MTSAHDEPTAPSHTPTIRQRRDVTGCGCIRCQGVGHHVVRRSFAGSFLWSGRLLWERPSVFAALVVVGVLQLLSLSSPVEPAMTSAVVGLVGIFVGRGYVGVVGAGHLGDQTPDIATGICTIFRRIPGFLGAVLVVAGTMLVIVGFVAVGLPAGIEAGADVVGLTLESPAIDLGVVLLAALLITYALVKFCFVPEACFVGGYGTLSAVRASWQLTSLHRRRALVLTLGLVGLFGVGFLLDAQFARADRPVVLSVTVAETRVPIRSLGLSTASLPRLLVDALLSTAYFGVFVHQYVHSVFDRNVD